MGRRADWLPGSRMCLSALLGLLGLLALSPLHAQPSIQWDKTLGGNDSDVLRSLLQTADGGYLLGGNSVSGISGEKSEASRGIVDYWLVRLDKNGNKLWDKSLGGSGSDVALSLAQTVDGGYVLGGVSNSVKSGEKSEDSRGGIDYWVVKLDANGNKLWDKTIGGSGNEILWSLVQTSDGGYVLGGGSESGKSGEKSEDSRGGQDYWVVKLDAEGNVLWDRTLGGSLFDDLKSIQQTTDGGYMLGGTSISGISGEKSEASRGSADYWVVKLDANGNKLWDKTLGGNSGEGFTSLRQTTDGGYVLGGTSPSNISGDKSEVSRNSYDYWVVKLDGEGNKLWDKTLGGGGDDYLRSIQQTTDGGYVLGGESQHSIGWDKSEASRGNSDYWVVKLDANGTKQWDKTLGGNNEDFLYSLQQTTDGGYVLGGYSNSAISGDKSEASQGSYDYWVVKLGCSIPGFTVSSQQVCLSTSVTFSDASANAGSSASYAWDMDGDGTTDYTGRESFAHTYPAAGTYTARLTVTEGNCVESFTMQIEVDASVAEGSVSGSTTVCAGSNRTLLQWVDPNEKIDEEDKKKKESSSSSSSTSPVPAQPSSPEAPSATSSPIQKWQSSTDGGNSWTNIAHTETTYTATNLTQTTHYRAVVKSGACGEAYSEPATITVSQPPVVDAGSCRTLYLGYGAACATLSATANQPGLSYAWTSGGSGSSVQVCPTATTNYTVTATNAAGCQGTATTTVEVLDIRSIDKNGKVKIWVCDGKKSKLKKPEHVAKYLAKGYTLGACGLVPCSGQPAPIAVAVATSCNIVYKGYGSGCLTLEASATGGYGELRFNWGPGLDGASVQVCPDKKTKYTLTVTDAHGYVATEEVEVDVLDVRCGKDKAGVELCHQGKNLCVAAGEVAGYLAQGARLGKCSDKPCTEEDEDDDASRIGVAEELTDLPVELAVEVYPNPASGAVTLRVRTSVSGAGTLEVLDLTGRALQRQQVELQ
ncbi:MAG: PKD domain-containing protein, partial [Bacteroidetes bacterium]|nr:PKD domain-containing protein [Bacteroidota bacterium]